MVLHKRLDYGSRGYQVPPMPRVPRSARGKRSVRKKVVDDKQISAFDLLATIAGEMSTKQENEVPLKAEVFDQGSCNESTLGSECKLELEIKPPALVSSDSSVKEMELVVDRDDDDEKSSACTHPSTKIVKAFRPQRIVDRRIRKLLASKFWKVPQTAFKEGELSNTDAERKHIYRNRRMFYMQQRTQRSSFKRRKLFEHCSIPDTQACLIGANGASSSSGHRSSYESGDYNVKFSIKSFKVPELFIEIPENATIGSLKRTVMEAVTAILSGGLRVGILLKGKKVRDDKQNLLQAGISRVDEVKNLGFTLEPDSSQPPLPSLTQRIRTSLLNGPENDCYLSVDKVDNSKALVADPGIMNDPLSVVPLRKSRRSELVQRRIRRPFSVAEVEALVQAVEKLGTGRWRDVKIRSFDNAKHRTYVDLKDKWKTLVHTARISPQQRRGEPVPQELLDRVLLTHAYWSKLQLKPID